MAAAGLFGVLFPVQELRQELGIGTRDQELERLRMMLDTAQRGKEEGNNQDTENGIRTSEKRDRKSVV